MSFPGHLGIAAVTAVASVLVAVAAVLGPAPAALADSVRAAQWHLRTLDIERAHEISRGKGVVVAVVDSGVDATHPDLKDNVADGYDIVAATDGKVDENGHGTGVAALIAAHGHGTDDGVLGVAPRASILPVRVSGRSGQYGSADAARAIRWAADRGADVINVSGGAPTDDPRMRGAVGYAQARDVVLVASAGNTDQGDKKVGYPAAYPGVIAVSAVDADREFSAESVQGPEVALAAPGERVVTATTGHDYAVGVGTSDASALVSGTAALVRARYPELDAAAVVNRLLRTAADRGPRGRDTRYGYGVVDPVAALTADLPEVTANPLGSVTPTPSATPTPNPSGTSAANPGPGGPPVPRNVLLPVLVGGGAVLLALVSLAVGWAMTARRRRTARP